MHSSRMHTARLLTISQHALCRGCLSIGVSVRGGFTQEVCLGGVCPGVSSLRGCSRHPPEVDTPCGQNDRRVKTLPFRKLHQTFHTMRQ